MPAGTRRGTRDHPRACGENFLTTGEEKQKEGSPPRVRGKRLHQHDGSGRGGITPARAGKTRPCRNRGCNRGDHPRACGENHIGTVAQGQAEGSPPRVRGKPVAAINIATSEGITPARAGKTYAFFCSTARSSDHPRACGENFKGCRWGSPSPGSPPRVRGKHAESVEAAKTAGITPARAGKTRPRAI